MDKMDFKEALEDFNITVDFIKNIGRVSSLHKNDFFPKNGHIEVIQAALRIADRLQSGEVSDDVHQSVFDILEVHKDFSEQMGVGKDALVHNVIKAMSKRLIKECKNN